MLVGVILMAFYLEFKPRLPIPVPKIVREPSVW